jgi:hypothetical protein
MSEKVIVLNGKRFIVGNSKIRTTKSYLSPKIKKLLSKKAYKRKQEKIFKRHPTTTSRKRRNTKIRKVIEED